MNNLTQTLKEDGKMTFSLKDLFVDKEVSPQNMTLPLLSEFVQQVTTFLKGKKYIDLTKIKSSIQHGSLAIEVSNNDGLLDEALKDYMTLLNHGSLNDIDSGRARIVELWQSNSKANPDRSYVLTIGDNPTENSHIIISDKTNFVMMNNNWVEVDLYLYGKVFDLGGKNKPNVHLELDNGNTIKIQTSSNLLSTDEENRLYKKQLVRIKAKRNIQTSQLKEERLVSFVYYNPQFDEKNFEEISEKATLAWKSVKSASQWVDEIRGN